MTALNFFYNFTKKNSNTSFLCLFMFKIIIFKSYSWSERKLYILPHTRSQLFLKLVIFREGSGKVYLGSQYPMAQRVMLSQAQRLQDAPNIHLYTVVPDNQSTQKKIVNSSHEKAGKLRYGVFSVS